jgi:hypothetical protein
MNHHPIDRLQKVKRGGLQQGIPIIENLGESHCRCTVARAGNYWNDGSNAFTSIARAALLDQQSPQRKPPSKPLRQQHR